MIEGILAVLITLIICLFLGKIISFFLDRNWEKKKLENDWIKHIPNPFGSSQLSKDFWRIEGKIRSDFVDEYKSHGYSEQWLKDYLEARDELTNEPH